MARTTVKQELSTSTEQEASTRDRIIDAAEELFSTHGYYGTTTREITRQAGVPLGLMSYHFGTKSELYSEVITRRSQEHVANIRASLKVLTDAHPDNEFTVDQLVRAFIRPMAEKSLYGGPGWRNYIRLVSRAAGSKRGEPYIESFSRAYGELEAEFIALLHSKHPDAAEEDIYWSFYFLASAIIHMLIESEDVDGWSGGLCKSTDLETIIKKMGPFIEAGMNRLASS